MNEKIKELKKQCYISVADPDRNGDIEYDMEKFAELIIKECIASIDDGNGSMSSISENTWRQICCGEIRSHFGIKK